MVSPSADGSAPRGSARLGFVDALRGMAVVAMVMFHCAAGWLEPSARQGAAWSWLRSMGGMGAPAFILLTGVVWALQRGRATRPAMTGLGRGLSLVALGYLLRLQMWMVDSGGMWHVAGWGVAAVCGTGWLGVWWGSRRLDREGFVGPRSRRPWLVLASGVVLVSGGLSWVSRGWPDALASLVRVDVLQAIGASWIAMTLGSRLLRAPSPRPAVMLGVGVAVACGTPLMRAWVPGGLPAPLAAYVASWSSPSEGASLAAFPLFPWMAYSWIGAALGGWWLRAARRKALEARVVRASVAGAVVAACVSEAWPWMYELLGVVPWLEQPVRVAYRAGVVAALAGMLWAWTRIRNGRSRVLQPLGRASLVVYWLHLELAFGIVSRPVSGALGLGGWLLGVGCVMGVMLAVAYLWPHRRRLKRLSSWRFGAFRIGGLEPSDRLRV